MLDSTIALNQNRPRPTPGVQTLGQLVALRGGQLENQQRQQQIVQNQRAMDAQRQAASDDAEAAKRLQFILGGGKRPGATPAQAAPATPGGNPGLPSGLVPIPNAPVEPGGGRPEPLPNAPVQAGPLPIEPIPNAPVEGGQGQPAGTPKLPDPEDLIWAVGPERAQKIITGIQALGAAKRKDYTDKQAIIRDAFAFMDAIPSAEQRAKLYPAAHDALVSGGVLDASELPPQYDEGWWQRTKKTATVPASLEAMLAAAIGSGDTAKADQIYAAMKKEAEAKRAPEKPPTPPMPQRGTGVNPTTHRPDTYQVDADGKVRWLGIAPVPSAAQQGGASGQTALYNATDPSAIAKAIIAGDLPPVISDYGRAVQGAVATALAKQGFDLSAARTDWNATQKHIQTMNGAQQLRLNQAINSLPDMLDNVDALSKQWKGGNFAILNRANVALAKGGAYGPKAASIANQLDAQIADVVADLGNVYMGGNSPTERALELAGKSLKSEWSEQVLIDMVGLARKNVLIRRNSINATGVQGASEDNPYGFQGRPAQAPPPAQAGPKVGDVVMVGNRKIKISAIHPDGTFDGTEVK
jgi:hypothetical protein